MEHRVDGQTVLMFWSFLSLVLSPATADGLGCREMCTVEVATLVVPALSGHSAARGIRFKKGVHVLSLAVLFGMETGFLCERFVLLS